jgi:cytochrome P450
VQVRDQQDKARAAAVRGDDDHLEAVPKEAMRLHPHTWIPFGGGVRRRIGAGFSLSEGVAVLREVLSTYDVRLPAGASEQPKVRTITSVPRHGARIVVTRR